MSETVFTKVAYDLGMLIWLVPHWAIGKKGA